MGICFHVVVKHECDPDVCLDTLNDDTTMESGIQRQHVTMPYETVASVIDHQWWIDESTHRSILFL